MGFLSCLFRCPEKEVAEEDYEEPSRIDHRHTPAVKSSECRPLKTESSMHMERIQTNDPHDDEAMIFTLRELDNATKHFRRDYLLGRGGFGCVYKAHLNSGQVVAVKQLDLNGLQGNREFLVEVLMLSLLHHPNLVHLLGYCVHDDQRLLVYEYMPLGSLEDHLHDLRPDQEPLDWKTRMKIAAGAAAGLEYLHNKTTPPVIYRDIKPSNILLGEGYHAKLADFGLAKLGPVGDKTHVTTRVMGTYGYCAPEYASTGQLTLKSDVYSFGVVFLELITGRRPLDSNRPPEEQNLVAWARPLFKDQKKFPTMADPLLKGQFPKRGLYQALAIAAMCLQEKAKNRPLIKEVANALSYLSSQSCDRQNIATPRALDGPSTARSVDDQGNEAPCQQRAQVSMYKQTNHFVPEAKEPCGSAQVSMYKQTNHFVPEAKEPCGSAQVSVYKQTNHFVRETKEPCGSAQVSVYKQTNHFVPEAKDGSGKHRAGRGKVARNGVDRERALADANVWAEAWRHHHRYHHKESRVQENRVR